MRGFIWLIFFDFKADESAGVVCYAEVVSGSEGGVVVF